MVKPESQSLPPGSGARGLSAMQEGGDWEGVRRPLDGPLLPQSREIGADLCPALELCVSGLDLEGRGMSGARQTQSSDSCNVRILSPEPGAWLDESKSAVAVKGVAYAGGGSKPQQLISPDSRRVRECAQVAPRGSIPSRPWSSRQTEVRAGKPPPATSRLAKTTCREHRIADSSRQGRSTR